MTEISLSALKKYDAMWEKVTGQGIMGTSGAERGPQLAVSEKMKSVKILNELGGRFSPSQASR